MHKTNLPNQLNLPPLGTPPSSRTPMTPLRFCFAIAHKINRHTGKLETPVSYRKQRTAPPINRHIVRGAFLSASTINRKPELIEPPVSCSKQRTGTQINRKLSPLLCFPIPTFTFPFSNSNRRLALCLKPRERYNVSFAETRASHPMRHIP